MDTDRLTTITGMVQAICTVLIPLVPPPFNLIPVAFAAAAFAIHGYATNKDGITAPSPVKVAGQVVVVLAMLGGLTYAGCAQFAKVEADIVKLDKAVYADLLTVCPRLPAIHAAIDIAGRSASPLVPEIAGAVAVADGAHIILTGICAKLLNAPLAVPPGAVTSVK